MRRTRESHGMYKSPEYAAWESMVARCNRVGWKRYADYGGRGIRVCPQWAASFLAFFESVGPRPSAKHSLDRIDNDADYTPSNVRWATRAQQMRNRRNTKVNEEDFRQIVCLRAIGVPSKWIGPAFGVSPVEVRRACPTYRKEAKL